MILDVKNALSTIAPKLTYDVLIENQEDGNVKAILLSLPECQGLGATKEEALNNLIQLFQARKPEIVTLEIEPPKTEHPWMKFAGMYKDDPHFDEVQQYIAKYRRELDAEMEEYYQQIDTEEKSK
jgi:predicted RNase H-like HicB family nuclease